MAKDYAHFQGKSALKHLIDARLKGLIASRETHGAEMPGHFSAAADSAKETVLLLILFWILIHPPLSLFIALAIGILIWKTGRSAILGYSQLERLHRLIEEERWEIEHHRDQEKEELKALYRAKGFTGKLLDEVIEVLMADDNRLLQVMLEEELGLDLESYEHPLKQAFGALIGVVGTSLLMLLGYSLFSVWGLVSVGAIIIALSGGLSAKIEKNKPLPHVVWNLAVVLLTSLIAYFINKLL